MPDPRLIVGLDVPDVDTARALVDRLGDTVGFYKVGLGLAPVGGFAFARELRQAGKQVFLDLKLFDIGATVAAAVRALAPVAPDFLTVHGDPHVVRAAVAARGEAPTRILAVTVLTSLDRSDLDEGLTVPGAVPDLVIERARRAFAAGADGVIASPERGRPPARPARGRGPADRHPRHPPGRQRRRRPEAHRHPRRRPCGRGRPSRRRPAGVDGRRPARRCRRDPCRDRRRCGVGGAGLRGRCRGSGCARDPGLRTRAQTVNSLISQHILVFVYRAFMLVNGRRLGRYCGGLCYQPSKETAFSMRSTVPERSTSTRSKRQARVPSVCSAR